MTCQHARELFPRLLTPHGEDGAHEEARTHLAECPRCRAEFMSLQRTATLLDSLDVGEPSAHLRENFRAMLEAEKRPLGDASAASPANNRGRRQPGSAAWRWVVSPLVGCALLACGFLIGQRGSKSSATAPAPAVVQDSSTRAELLALRQQLTEQRQQLDKMTTLVGYSILQQQQNPANERLRDVLAAARAENVNDKVLDDLIQALTLDPSVNVRLRALEALYPHAERAMVRAGVLAALPREKNPLVQLELIEFVATAGDADAAPLLEQISAVESNDRTVRDAARLALAQL